MTTPRYPLGTPHSGHRRVTIIEGGLALSVIIGLGFVSFRILADAPKAAVIQNLDTQARPVMAEATSADGDVASAKAQ